MSSPAPLADEFLQRATPRARLTLWAVGLVVFAFAHSLSPNESGLWLPSLGIGIALVAWLGYQVLPALLGLVFLINGASRTEPTGHLLLAALLFAGQIGVSWRVFRDRAKASPWLHDPLSATLFLIIVAGLVPLMFGSLDAFAATRRQVVFVWSDFWFQASTSTLSRTLGVLSIAPVLLVVVTPLLHHLRALDEPRSKPFSIRDWTWGEGVEIAGLIFANLVLDILMTRLHVERGFPGWALWGASLLVIVWAAIRQGLRGATLVSACGIIAALTVAQAQGVSPSIFSPLQGNLLAQASTALMVGASVGWIRDREVRYRHVVGHIPVVLYSVRLQRGLPTFDPEKKMLPRQMPRGSQVVEEAEVTLVSPASKKVLGADPEILAGPFVSWLRRVDASDREVLLAAMAQLCMQREPVICEYRVLANLPISIADIDLDSPAAKASPADVRWVRDTMVPRRSAEGLLEGWEGILEDVTEARSLSNNLRKMSGMFQALVTNMPAGIFFVSGPIGQPILVNARARQLLGQREDVAAGLDQLSSTYRLHRPDGSEYPVEELPVTLALRKGRACMAKDIVVHRPDGKKMNLVTWAAPVDLGPGQGNAAVWVLEDLTQVERAEMARRESEARLRAVFDSMAEGVVILDGQGNAIESNPAATSLLNLSPTLPRKWMAPDECCVREDGSPFPCDEHPDRLAMKTGQAVHKVVMGIPAEGGELRWLLFHAVPLPPNVGPARLVVTIDDITANRRLQDELRQSQRLELIGKIAGGIVHDFNNLLTAIVGTAALMEMGLRDQPMLRADAARIVEIGEQASHLASQLLTFGKGRTDGHASSDLNTAVVHSVRLLRSLLPPMIHTEVHLHPTDVMAPLEDMQLKQIVMNLALNARDAMPEGGHLRIRTTLQPNGAMPACLEVEDTGIGMSEDVQRRIFEPFYTTKERGTGLGLAAVKQIIESCGGSIEIDSKPNQGTRVKVLFPPPSA